MSVAHSEETFLPTGQNSNQEYRVQAGILDWFSQLFIAPPSRKLLEQCFSAKIMAFLSEFGETLEAPELTKMIADFFRNHSIDELDRTLSQQFISLFDGAGGPCSVPPYESCYKDANGRLFQIPYVEMLDNLSRMDVSVSSALKEPADHLALEIAALAEAFRQQDEASINGLLMRLTDWVPQMSTAVSQVAAASFYDQLLRLLVIYLTAFGCLVSNKDNFKL
ncbi:molecular chaperone TorD family protein [uncultured Bartonella sp.]|uniref:TorD/DmsD family molecular chaperone n=1 Tax=uncultured Bartonella sp. TaxID=104108 RepID=UPI0026232373|nr:molecular chaperone TorD family protein [uncultured Bartonella sp.]